MAMYRAPSAGEVSGTNTGGRGRAFMIPGGAVDGVAALMAALTDVPRRRRAKERDDKLMAWEEEDRIEGRSDRERRRSLEDQDRAEDSTDRARRRSFEDEDRGFKRDDRAGAKEDRIRRHGREERDEQRDVARDQREVQRDGFQRSQTALENALAAGRLSVEINRDARIGATNPNTRKIDADRWAAADADARRSLPPQVRGILDGTPIDPATGLPAMDAAAGEADLAAALTPEEAALDAELMKIDPSYAAATAKPGFNRKKAMAYALQARGAGPAAGP